MVFQARSDRHREARKATITVRCGGTDDGGFVDFTTADAANIEAIHDFLRFLINNLKTGDSTEIKEKPRANTSKIRR